MGLGQSSKAPVTDDTDEGECVLFVFSCCSEDQRTKRLRQKKVSLCFLRLGLAATKIKPMFLMLMPVL